MLDLAGQCFQQICWIYLDEQQSSFMAVCLFVCLSSFIHVLAKLCICFVYYTVLFTIIVLLFFLYEIIYRLLGTPYLVYN